MPSKVCVAFGVFAAALALGCQRDHDDAESSLDAARFTVGSSAPTREWVEAELEAYYLEHREHFREETIVSFRAVRVGERASHSAPGRAELLVDVLESGGDASPLVASAELLRGDEEMSLVEVRREYGAEFATELARAPLGRWSGPLEARAGAYVVRVAAKMPGRLPALDDVRAEVVLAYEKKRSAARRVAIARGNAAERGSARALGRLTSR